MKGFIDIHVAEMRWLARTIRRKFVPSCRKDERCKNRAVMNTMGRNRTCDLPIFEREF